MSSPQKQKKKQKCSTDTSIDVKLKSLHQKFEADGQGHVFKFLDRLNATQKQELYNNLSSINIAELKARYERIKIDENEKAKEIVEPFTGNVADLSTVSKTDKQHWYDVGVQLVSEGKVGILLMAGGQGTRLGSNNPKGMYDIGLPSGKSLFQIQAERIIKLKKIAHKSRKEPTKNELQSDLFGTITTQMKSVRLPWYILTSMPTHKKTVDFFRKNNFFGLPAADVYFFNQGLSPCLTPDGKLILKSMTELALAPNGNGGLYTATKQTGILADMKKRGLEYLHCYGVDNILVKVADPYCIGFMKLEDSDCCNKVVLKENPSERVGVMCLRNGKPGVVEYSEISEEDANLRDENGKLVYSAGNIAMHFFSLSFIEKIASSPTLPYHIARKKIPYVNDTGETIKPEAVNGIKMEMFIFDVFYRSERITCFAVKREEEFSPVKNMNGAPDAPMVGSSPDSARLALSDYHIHLVTQNGGKVAPRTDRSKCFEISPLISYDGEDIAKIVNGKSYPQPYHLNTLL